MTAPTNDIGDTEARLPAGVGMALRMLAANWRWGRLRIVLPDGTVRQFEGAEPGRSAVLVVRDFRFAARVLKSGDIGFGEAYMAGEWDSPDLACLLETIVWNYDHIRRLFDGGLVMNAVHWLWHRLNRNSRRGARRNIHAHYDLGNEFYAAWLDPSMTYSAARFASPGEGLETAQRRKYAALARHMQLGAGNSVLEIGCGWGGFATFAATEYQARVTAVTISREQHDFVAARIQQQGLSGLVDVRLCDYRDVTGTFDRIASIEMFEAVGRKYWPAYFNKVHDLLAPGGRAGLQVITIHDDLFDEYHARTDFIQKYVFPGGMLPSEERLQPVLRRAGLQLAAIDRFGPDYAETLHRWRERFDRSWPEIQRLEGFDQRFRRMWQFYLAYCEAGFRSARTDVVQMALVRG